MIAKTITVYTTASRETDYATLHIEGIDKNGDFYTIHHEWLSMDRAWQLVHDMGNRATVTSHKGTKGSAFDKTYTQYIVTYQL